MKGWAVTDQQSAAAESPNTAQASCTLAARRARREQALQWVKEQYPDESGTRRLHLCSEALADWEHELAATDALDRAMRRFRELSLPDDSAPTLFLMFGACLEAEGLDSPELAVWLPRQTDQGHDQDAEAAVLGKVTIQLTSGEEADDLM